MLLKSEKNDMTVKENVQYLLQRGLCAATNTQPLKGTRLEPILMYYQLSKCLRKKKLCNKKKDTNTLSLLTV